MWPHQRPMPSLGSSSGCPKSSYRQPSSIHCCLATFSRDTNSQSRISFRFLHKTYSTCVHLLPVLYVKYINIKHRTMFSTYIHQDMCSDNIHHNTSDFIVMKVWTKSLYKVIFTCNKDTKLLHNVQSVKTVCSYGVWILFMKGRAWGPGKFINIQISKRKNMQIASNVNTFVFWTICPL